LPSISKKNRKITYLVCTLAFAVVCLSLFNFNSGSDDLSYYDNNDNSDDNFKPILEETFSPENKIRKSGPLGYTIHVDNNWTETRNLYAWCTGNGLYGDPFVIQDVEIDANGGTGILIENNETSYFRIENCTIYNAGSGINAAIKFNDTNNGTIIQNNITNNQGMGVYIVSHCVNHTIFNNTIVDNGWSGIEMDEVGNITIESNNLTNNFLNGIRATQFNNTIIFNNTISDGGLTNTLYGINITNSKWINVSNNAITRGNRAVFLDTTSLNHVHNNSITGSIYPIYLLNSNSCEIYHNNIDGDSETTRRGIILDDSNSNNIYFNELFDISDNNGADDKAIYLENSDSNHIYNNSIYPAPNVAYQGISLELGSSDNHVYNNTINGPFQGIRLTTAPDNYIYQNILRNIDNYGIMCADPDGSEIYLNEIDGQGNTNRGMWLYTTPNSVLIYNNTIYDTITYGMHLEDFTNCFVYNNTLTDCGTIGIYLDGGSNNNFTQNSITQCTDGIELVDTDSNKIYFNDIYDNSGKGIDIDPCDWNEIYNNTISNNDGAGIELYGDGGDSCEYNQIFNNSFFACDYSIDMYYADHNIITDNTFGNTSSVQHIRLRYSDNNTISYNKFTVAPEEQQR
jgi:parallel beta-helix repeat protein